MGPRDGASAYATEQSILKLILVLGHMLFEFFLTLVGPGDLEKTVALEDGRKLNRLEQQKRRLVTVFGEFVFYRFVYGARESQKGELAPTDQRLQLPEGELSYLLQDWDQTLGTDHPFRMATKTMEKMLDLKQSVDTLERGNRQMAEVAPAFRGAAACPKTQSDGRHRLP